MSKHKPKIFLTRFLNQEVYWRQKQDIFHQYNYQIKQDIFNNELVDDEEYYKQQGILNVNDETIMFDVIIDELSKVHPLYARIRL